jgi:PAS domain S-box-containing protein
MRTSQPSGAPQATQQDGIAGKTLRVVIPYVIVGALWILFSDAVLSRLVLDHEQIAIVSTMKGWLFVTLTAVFLYVLFARVLRGHRHALAELRRAQSRYRLIAENTADVIWVLDLSLGKLTYVSPSVTALRGLPADEVLRQRLDEVLSPESAVRVRELLPARIAAFEAGDESKRVEIERVNQAHADGHVVPTEVVTSLVTDGQGRVVQLLGVSRDISERVRTEVEIQQLNQTLERRVTERTAQLETANRELEAFTYSVSHDLRAPLRAIDGFARILTEDHAAQLDHEGRRMLGIVRSEATRMGRLIDDLLEFSRAIRRPVKMATVEMTDLASSVRDECLSSLGHRQVTCMVYPLPSATGDAALLRQVLTNLVSNALKYTRPRADARIEIGGALGHGEVVYHVRDNGVGFDMRYASKLFGVFQRLHTDDEFEGTGVGLALVQRIVQRHGGRVWAEAVLDAGATFYFSLPARQP